MKPKDVNLCLGRGQGQRRLISEQRNSAAILGSYRTWGIMDEEQLVHDGREQDEYS